MKTVAEMRQVVFHAMQLKHLGRCQQVIKKYDKIQHSDKIDRPGEAKNGGGQLVDDLFLKIQLLDSKGTEESRDQQKGS